MSIFAVFSPAAPSNITAGARRAIFFVALFALLLAAHLRHSGVLWAEEDLPLAAAMKMKRGAVIYRDIWFDKPPLVPAIYLLWGVSIGPLLRLAGALYDLFACILAFALTTRLWSQREGYVAAALTAFFLTFDTHSAVLPLAADLLLLVPHLAAVLLAIRGKPLLSGIAAGIGFLFNAKAVFVLLACALFAWPGVPGLLAGFAIPNVLVLAYLAAAGAWPGYVDQVWRWPALYAGSPIVTDPVFNGLIRTANWLGFHAVLVIGAVVCVLRERRWKIAAWIALAYIGVVLGWRFFPRYFFLLLPALLIPAARGVCMIQARSKAVFAVLLLTLAIPLARFAPRYISLDHWNDLALDEDSRAASRIVRAAAPPSATLYVWGYRPEIYVYTGLKPATKYLECQALTGVPADRHLTQSTVVLAQGAHDARLELARSMPDVLLDGLSPFNPSLAIRNYPELRNWLSQYHEIAHTNGAIIYLRSTMR
jgi:hypothetical protein